MAPTYAVPEVCPDVPAAPRPPGGTGRALASIEVMLARAERDLGLHFTPAVERLDQAGGFADAVAAHCADFLQYMVMRGEA